MTREFYLDTEFTCDSRDGYTNLDFLSIGVVRDDGAEYYAQNAHHRSIANPFVKEEVIPKLEHIDDGKMCDWFRSRCVPTATSPCVWKEPQTIADELKAFFNTGDENRVWTDGGAHDLVVVTSIFDGYDKVPDHIPTCFYDYDIIGSLRCAHVYGAHNPRKHHALADARELHDIIQAHQAGCTMFRLITGIEEI